MRTLSEIQAAVTHLPRDEKKALALWLNSQTEPKTTLQDEQLLRSLDQAISDLDAGKGVAIDEARKRVASWVTK